MSETAAAKFYRRHEVLLLAGTVVLPLPAAIYTFVLAVLYPGRIYCPEPTEGACPSTTHRIPDAVSLPVVGFLFGLSLACSAYILLSSGAWSFHRFRNKTVAAVQVVLLAWFTAQLVAPASYRSYVLPYRYAAPSYALALAGNATSGLVRVAASAVPSPLVSRTAWSARLRLVRLPDAAEARCTPRDCDRGPLSDALELPPVAVAEHMQWELPASLLCSGCRYLEGKEPVVRAPEGQSVAVGTRTLDRSEFLVDARPFVCCKWAADPSFQCEAC
eukprot:m51a1_g278 hypothetical protein (274) ;mRNA; f:270264-271473